MDTRKSLAELKQIMERCKKNQLKQKKNYEDHLVKYEEKNVL